MSDADFARYLFVQVRHRQRALTDRPLGRALPPVRMTWRDFYSRVGQRPADAIRRK